MDAKLLTENGWKAIVAKLSLKDTGLKKALASYEAIDDRDFSGRLGAISQVIQIAGVHKKAKDIAAMPAAVKYLADLLSAAQAEQNVISKALESAKKTADLAQKKEVAATSGQKPGGDKAEEEEQEEADYGKRLLAAFVRLKSSKDLVYQFLICDAKPHCGLMVTKRLTPKHKDELTTLTGGSKRFLKPGTCQFIDKRFVFDLEIPVTGLARKLQSAIKAYTGKKLPIRVGTEIAEADEETAPQPAGDTAPTPVAEPASSAATAQTMEALEDRRKAFKQARAAWVNVKNQAEMDLEKVKDGAKTMYLADAVQFPKIAKGCKDIDSILDTLDDALRDTLDQYSSTPLKNQAKLQSLGTKAIEILDQYHAYVDGNEVLKAIDLKEFADVTIHAPIMKALADLRKALS